MSMAGTGPIKCTHLLAYLNQAALTGFTHIMTALYQNNKKEYSYSWDEQGTYSIRAKTKDIYDMESDWSTLVVEMPKYKQLPCFNLLKIFERFSWITELFKILKEFN